MYDIFILETKMYYMRVGCLDVKCLVHKTALIACFRCKFFKMTLLHEHNRPKSFNKWGGGTKIIKLWLIFHNDNIRNR